MAIGDSLLNGMRSYTINQSFAAASIPARLGDALGDMAGFSRFRPTTYPEPVLIDIEATVAAATSSCLSLTALSELAAHIPTIKRSVRVNGRNWFGRFRAPAALSNHQPCFDNIAIAGARIEDVFEITHKQVLARITAMEAVVNKVDDPLSWSGDWPVGDPYRGPGKIWGMGDVHIAINSRHLRDPANLGGLDGMTVLDMVAARQPKVLLIDLGPNHGIVDVVMRNAGKKGMDGLRDFAARWPACAKELAALPGVETVVVMLMPRPSQVPCMTPPREAGADAEPAPPGGKGYFDFYVSALSPIHGGEGYDRNTMIQLDREMDAVNAEVRAATEQAFKGKMKDLRFVSLADLIAPFDFKHRTGQRLKVPGTRRSYSNYPMGIRPIWKLKGGFCGLDHIHPSALGYRYIAEEIRKVLPATIPSQPIALTDLDDTFLTPPDLPTLAVLEALLPNSDEQSPLTAAPSPGSEADRLLHRPGWLR
jgi:hypothetical protein